MFTSQVVKNEARRLGFTLAGVTTPDPPLHMPAYENWLSLGRHGTMNYLAGERARACRRDPRLILPDCRSILVLAARYPDPETGKAGGWSGPAGRVAAYAWGRDYHLVLPQRLQALVTFIEQQVGNKVAQRWYTDSGPILERDLAQRAGLGWIGKNTCLINPKIGSYFLLAEILLGIALEPDPPFTADRCGTCKRCIAACPTGCILPDRTIDARRCLAYLTIENKDEIPPDLRPQMGDWVFGCDVCQMVCPWNRFATKEYDQGLAFPPDRTAPDLRADLRLTPQEFNRKFKDSPVQRARRRGYLRNVAVALGNLGNMEDIPALEEALQDAEPLVRQHAGWALKQIRNS
ncbi:MAG: tRNA epoxyqueuosine(34) reductase QueG [Anaerolineales bacterium]